MLGKLLAVGAALLILLVPAVSAQDQARVSETEFKVAGEGAQSDPTKGIKVGEGAFGFVNMQYCYNGPALNPSNGRVTASITLTAPEWLTVVDPDDMTWQPPATYAERNDDPKDWECGLEQAQVDFSVARDAPQGETGDIVATITVTEDQAMGESTYQSVAGEYEVTIPVKVAEPEPDPVTGLLPGETNTTAPASGPDETTEESPLPTPIVSLLALVAVAALRRRD